MMRLLIIEDDDSTADFIVRGFEQEGHTVDRASDGLDGLMLATDSHYDVLVVDRMLPRLDGLNFVKTLRSQNNDTPVIFLSALDSLDQRLDGFEQGGDDYLVKPFAFAELSARVASLARRQSPARGEDEHILTAKGVTLNRLKRTVTREGRPVDLQPTEFKILDALLARAGTIVTRTMLFEQVWDFHFDPQTSVIETHISRLRSKIDEGFDKGLIRTVRGAGYVIDETT